MWLLKISAGKAAGSLDNEADTGRWYTWRLWLSRIFPSLLSNGWSSKRLCIDGAWVSKLFLILNKWHTVCWLMRMLCWWAHVPFDELPKVFEW